jgi:hypothetical protein
MRRIAGALAAAGLCCLAPAAHAADQTVPGAWNAEAARLAAKSPLVSSAYDYLLERARDLRDKKLREETLDAIGNPATCIRHRAGLTDADKSRIIEQLRSQGLINPADDASFPGGLRAGVFPPVKADGGDCPRLPMPFYAAPGSSFGSHHSQPGGLPVHEAFNDLSDLSLAANYRKVYDALNEDGLPVLRVRDGDDEDERDGRRNRASDFRIDRDLIVAAPMWHDWAKPIVFQWLADGTEFKELNFGGSGANDAWGQPGDSRTGAHHIIGLAESMKRGLPPGFVITQASAHAAPALGNEYKVVNWLRAAALLAQIDPVAAGYLVRDTQARLRLPPLRRLGEADFNAGATPQRVNMLVEYVLHNLSDADFGFTVPAAGQVDSLLRQIAPEYGYDPADPARYNTRFRNPVLSYLSAERLYIVFSNGGMAGLKAELDKLRRLRVI